MQPNRVWTVVAVVLVISVKLLGQPPAPQKPGAEHQRLAALVGKWSFEGQAQRSPYGPAGRVTSSDTFAWIPGNFFVEHHWEVNQAGMRMIGREIIGYDTVARVYTSHFFDNFGNSGSMKATVDGDTWSWTADSVVAGKPLKERGTLVLRGDTMNVKWEYSSDGAKWLLNFETKGTRVK